MRVNSTKNESSSRNTTGSIISNNFVESNFSIISTDSCVSDGTGAFTGASMGIDSKVLLHTIPSIVITLVFHLELTDIYAPIYDLLLEYVDYYVSA